MYERETPGHHKGLVTNVDYMRGFPRSRRFDDRRNFQRKSSCGIAKAHRTRFPRRTRPPIHRYLFLLCLVLDIHREESVRNDALSLKGEIVIGNEYVGAILGRRGSTINSIRARSNAYVNLSESRDGRMRRIEICGEEPQVVNFLLYFIMCRVQVMEAHRLINHIIHREYPEYLPKNVVVPMRTTIELKMSISLATYLTGLNRTMLTEIERTTGVSATLQGQEMMKMFFDHAFSDIENDDRLKLVILTGSYDKILEAYNAVVTL